MITSPLFAVRPAAPFETVSGRRDRGGFARSVAPVALLCAVILSGCAQRGDPRWGACDPPGSDVLDAVIAVEDEGGGRFNAIVVAGDTVVTAAHALFDTEFPGTFTLPQTGETVGVDAPLHAATALEIAADPLRDVALLSWSTTARPVPIAASPPEKYEVVVIVGAPLALYERIVGAGVHQGVDRELLLSEVPVTRGNSGGALLVCRHREWQLAGVVVGASSAPFRMLPGVVVRGIAAHTSVIVGHLAYSVPAHVVSELLEEAQSDDR